MKTAAKPLKHYRRKRFFYKLLWRRSFRTGAMFGMAWQQLILLLFPFFLWYCFSWLFASGSDSFERMFGFLLLMLPFTVCCIYGFLVLVHAFSAMLRSVIPNDKAAAPVAMLLTLFFPFAGIAALVVLAKEKRWLFALFAGISLALAVLCYFVSVPGIVPWLVSWIGLAFLFVALAGIRDRDGLRFYFLWPLAGALALTVGVFCYEAALRRDLVRERAELSKIAGRSVALADYRARDAAGFPVGDEPLKSLIARKPGGEEDTGKPREMVEEYRKKNPEFIEALRKTVKLPAQAIAHVWPEDNMIVGMQFEEYGAFREGARYLALSIKADPENRENVRYCNAGMERLRDWMLAGNALIARLVAISIESMRLNALSYPLATGTISAADWQELLGKEPDWSTEFIRTLGDEAAVYDAIFDFMVVGLKGKLFESEAFPLKTLNGAVQAYMPLFARIHLLRDQRFCLLELKKANLLRNPDGLTAVELAKRMKFNEEEAKRNIYIFSTMLLSAQNAIALKKGEIEDRRRFAQIAWQVMEYRRTHEGKLPESLDFLPEKPLDSMTRQPIRYEAGKLQLSDDREGYGFRLSFEPSDEFSGRGGYTVLLK